MLNTLCTFLYSGMMFIMSYLSIQIVRKNNNNLIKYQFINIDDARANNWIIENPIYTIPKVINFNNETILTNVQYVNKELLYNLFNIIFSFGVKSWFNFILSTLIFCFNIYIKIKMKNNLLLIQKEKRAEGLRFSMIFKIKYIVYTIIYLYTLKLNLFYK